MAEEELVLVYEQDEVQFQEGDGSSSSLGRLRLIEKGADPAVEWLPNVDDLSDNEWALISPPSVAFSIKKISDPVIINNCKKTPEHFFSYLRQIRFCKVYNRSRNLDLLNLKKEAVASFYFNSENADFFFDVLQRYVIVRPQEGDSTLFLLQNKQEGNIDDKLSALKLVPNQKTTTKHRAKSPMDGASYVPPWASAPKKVLGFFHNMKKDPYTTTLTTLCKVYDVVLYGGEEESLHNGVEDEEVADLLHQISGMDDLEPGYEILTKRGQLADRPQVDRLEPLTHEEFKSFVRHDSVVADVSSLRKRIFKGGIHSNLRPELWCYLLDYYKWDDSHSEKESRRRAIEQRYFEMKQQWKTVSETQEKNFSAFRDRKSLIEKDVNRTDRNHPFYEGEDNPNLEALNDVLMTYIMYNFDLGYVQGMSDLLAPILYVMQNEPAAFWCFVGFMDRVFRNFDLDQSGMKQQLLDLTQLLRVIDPELVSFLEARDSANLYFCFRWLLVRFKRELNYNDTLRLWEVLWTGYPCKNFHLCVAAAILDTERDEIIENKFGFTDILKHINGLSLSINLEYILKKAEAIYLQLEATPTVPNSVREILELPLLPEPEENPSFLRRPPACSEPVTPGHAERISSPLQGGIANTVSYVADSINSIATSGRSSRERAYESSSAHSNFS